MASRRSRSSSLLRHGPPRCNFTRRRRFVAEECILRAFPSAVPFDRCAISFSASLRLGFSAVRRRAHYHSEAASVTCVYGLSRHVTLPVHTPTKTRKTSNSAIEGHRRNSLGFRLDALFSRQGHGNKHGYGEMNELRE